MAFHPYPQDLNNPRPWKDDTATDSFDTYRITFKNLQILVQYLQQTNLLYNGEQRHTILSEQGFNGGNNSKAAQELQAAAYAYAYYKAASLPGIDAFILHRHVDHMQEGGLMLGLWTCESGQIFEPYKQKTIYNVFKDIDRTNSYDVSKFALAVIAKEVKGITRWSDLIPEFNPERIDATLPEIKIANTGVSNSYQGLKVIDDMQKGIDDWKATDNVSEIKKTTENGSTFLSGKAVSEYRKDYCGVTYYPKTPVLLILCTTNKPHKIKEKQNCKAFICI